MSQDILEEAKEALASPNKLKFHATFWMNLAVDLKDEVERLRARRVPMDEQDKKANQIMRDAIDSITKERDELEERLEKYEQ